MKAFGLRPVLTVLLSSGLSLNAYSTGGAGAAAGAAAGGASVASSAAMGGVYQMAKGALVQGEAGVALSGVDVAGTVADCVKDKASMAATGSPSPWPIPWQSCVESGYMNLVMNGLGLISSIMALQQNKDNEVDKKVEGEEPAGGAAGGGAGSGGIPGFDPGSFDFNPDTGLGGTSNLCEENPDMFGCKPEDFTNLDTLEEAFNSGEFELPSEAPADFFDQLRSAGNYVASGMEDVAAGLGATKGDGFKSGKGGQGDTGTGGSFKVSGAGNTVGGTMGPQNKDGLGHIVFNGSLTAVDDATGKELTLWQRATRRYLGIQTGVEGTPRGNTLARMEFMRQQAMRKLKVTSAPSELKPKEQAVKKEVAPSRAPASVKTQHALQ